MKFGAASWFSIDLDWPCDDRYQEDDYRSKAKKSLVRVVYGVL